MQLPSLSYKPKATENPPCTRRGSTALAVTYTA